MSQVIYLGRHFASLDASSFVVYFQQVFFVSKTIYVVLHLTVTGVFDTITRYNYQHQRFGFTNERELTE